MELIPTAFACRNKIRKSQEFVLLAVAINDKLSIKAHVEYISRTAKYKLDALQQIEIYLSLN